VAIAGLTITYVGPSGGEGEPPPAFVAVPQSVPFGPRNNLTGFATAGLVRDSGQAASKQHDVRSAPAQGDEVRVEARIPTGARGPRVRGRRSVLRGCFRERSAGNLMSVPPQIAP